MSQDCFRLESPGGGGYGKPISSESNDEDQQLLADAAALVGSETTEAENPSKKRKIHERSSKTYTERGSVHEYRRLQESV